MTFIQLHTYASCLKNSAVILLVVSMIALQNIADTVWLQIINNLLKLKNMKDLISLKTSKKYDNMQFPFDNKTLKTTYKISQTYHMIKQERGIIITIFFHIALIRFANNGFVHKCSTC